jgi:hypothetical protein
MIEFNRYPTKEQIWERCANKKNYTEFDFNDTEESENELIVESAEDVINDSNIDENLREVLLWMLEKMK